MSPRRLLAGLALLALVPAVEAGAPEGTRYLAQLQGPWSMTGEVMGKPVSYAARGRWQLNGAWLEFAMTDSATPPAYEARLYLGYDGRAHDFIAHWLDRFGAAGARVVGTGTLEGRTLTIVFPYAQGTFRDTLTLDPQGSSGTLLLEQQGKDGQWSRFADYALRRTGRH